MSRVTSAITRCLISTSLTLPLSGSVYGIEYCNRGDSNPSFFFLIPDPRPTPNFILETSMLALNIVIPALLLGIGALGAPLQTEVIGHSVDSANSWKTWKTGRSVDSVDKFKTGTKRRLAQRKERPIWVERAVDSLNGGAVRPSWVEHEVDDN
ncbi:hypothetical protein B0H19DRAFT_1272885 [Mycena capillaripes]|nr:hypothetical protein B0H19DRAFT_1272885 [Mycena capillaripes]